MFSKTNVCSSGMKTYRLPCTLCLWDGKTVCLFYECLWCLFFQVQLIANTLDDNRSLCARWAVIWNIIRTNGENWLSQWLFDPSAVMLKQDNEPHICPKQLSLTSYGVKYRPPPPQNIVRVIGAFNGSPLKRTDGRETTYQETERAVNMMLNLISLQKMSS